MISIGMTGTRQGMTSLQKLRISQFLNILKPNKGVHGDAIGADAEFHDLFRQLVVNSYIVIHPPTNPKYRAFKQGDLIYAPLPYLVRDDNIIREVDLMFGFPKRFNEELRSGTWTTIRHTRKPEFNKPLVIIYPDGSCSSERLENLKGITDQQTRLFT